MVLRMSPKRVLQKVLQKVLPTAPLALACLLVVGAPSAPASNALTESAEASLQALQSLQKCGEAKLSVLFWDVYESALYTPTGSWEPSVRPLRLQIRYLRDIAAKDLVKQTRKEWEAQSLSHPSHPEWLATLETLWPDVTKGDLLDLYVDENNISTFYFNGEKLGEIGEPLFGEHFAGIWLSPNTTRPELRAALIGKS